MTKRVVVTGLGVISSIGIGKDAFWKSLIAAKSGITKISSLDTSQLPTHYGAEVKDFNPFLFIDKRRALRLGRASTFAIAAAKLALTDAALNLDKLPKERVGVSLGTTNGESQIIQELDDTLVKKGLDAINPALIARCPANVLPSNVALEFKLRGPNYLFTTACAAGNYAIGYAFDLIRAGETDIMLAGGADAFSRIALIGFNRMLAVAPEKCQPFDKNRKGMLVGEGAAILTLESLDAALARKANIYAEILGYGLSCDAHHMTAPYSEGIKEAIKKALKESKVLPEEVSYFNAHGTGTPANDKEECLAIKNVFQNYSKLPVSSIKSMLGHTMGAASAIEAATCALAVKEDIIPPTINYETPDPECDIDCVPNTARRLKVNIALNNSSAFGGNNACLVLKKFLS
jgi:3-oxoacyl-[acyl-carrier-protein] synthase II